MNLKDKKITILKPTWTQTSYGAMEEEYEPSISNIWAYYRQLSGKEYYAAAMVNSKEEALFEINYLSDIDTTMRILFRNETYHITRVDDYQGYKQTLKIYTYKIN